MITNIEESLNGGYKGLHWEVTEEDTYRLKTLGFIPDIFIDLGANIGITSRFVRELFPECKIVSVEPDETNCEVFRAFTGDTNTILIQKAIGVGKIWKCEGAANGSGETYISAGLGYPLFEDIEYKRLVQTEVETILPYDIITEYVKEGMKTAIKIDVEGAENSIFTHEPSMQALLKMDYITMEIHNHALTGKQIDEVRQTTFESLASFIPTHNCQLINKMFYAKKRSCK